MPMCVPQPKKQPQLGGELRPLGAVVPGGPSTMDEPSTVPIHPGEGFWINPFGLENGAGSLVAYFELMVLIRSASAELATRRPSRRSKSEGRTPAGVFFVVHRGPLKVSLLGLK